MAKLKLAGYSEKFFEIREDNIVVEFYQRSMLKKHNCFKLTSCGKYSKETSFGNSWELFKIVPVNEKGRRLN